MERTLPNVNVWLASPTKYAHCQTRLNGPGVTSPVGLEQNSSNALDKNYSWILTIASIFLHVPEILNLATLAKQMLHSLTVLQQSFDNSPMMMIGAWSVHYKIHRGRRLLIGITIQDQKSMMECDVLERENFNKTKGRGIHNHMRQLLRQTMWRPMGKNISRGVSMPSLPARLHRLPL